MLHEEMTQIGQNISFDQSGIQHVSSLSHHGMNASRATLKFPVTKCVIADPNFLALYATGGRKVKTDK